MSRKSNDPVPVEQRLQLALAVLAHKLTVLKPHVGMGSRRSQSTGWRNRFVDAGKAAMEDGMPGKAGARGSLIKRGQRAEIQELKLALAEATVQLRIWQKDSEYIDQVPFADLRAGRRDRLVHRHRCMPTGQCAGA